VEEKLPLTISQIMIPSIGTGLLSAGLVLYTYLALSFKKNLYWSMVFTLLASFGFVFCETGVIVFGAVLHEWDISMQFNRIQQLSVSLYMIVLPIMMGELLSLDGFWRRFNRGMTFLFLVIFAGFVLIAFIAPDIFVSMTEKRITELNLITDYGRGREGVLYHVRDILIGFIIAYTMISIILDLFVNSRFRLLLIPLLGVIVAAFGGINDMLYLYTGRSFDPFDELIFSRFSLGLIFFVITLMIALNRNFVAAVKSEEAALDMMTRSERKYRALIEGSAELIFILDEDFRIKDVNCAVYNFLKIPKAHIPTLSLFDLVYKGMDKESVGIQKLSLKRDELLKHRDPVQFRTELKSCGITGPREFQLRMEFIDMEGSREILCKASEIGENMLLKYLIDETQRYQIGNFLIPADEVGDRLTRNVAKYVTQQEYTSLRVGLREVIVNAIEHGNLAISFEEKSSAMDAGHYEELFVARQHDERYAARRVSISYVLTPQKVIYRIEDEGNGFDFAAMIARINEREAAGEFMVHGRGLQMIRSIFDEIEYSGKGNIVTLIKHFTPA
jgi:PAS domain-containing protein